MSQGILLTWVEIIIVVLVGVVLLLFSTSFIESIGATTFGFKCYFAFAEYNVVNNFLFPITYFVQPILGSNPFIQSTQASSEVQGACVQQSNINGQGASSLSQQIYTKAASCFNLFQGANANAGDEILSSSSIGGVFECYSGVIYDSATTGTSNTYGSLINYIDQNYSSSGDNLQIVLITNGSGGTATYVDPSEEILNGSTYIIEYFGYPSKNPPSGGNCTLSFQAQCEYTSQFQQPYSSNTQCSYKNQSVASAYNTVSSLTNVNSVSTQPYNKIGVCGDYYVHFCGRLLNTMILSQDRVFVCITKS